MMVTSEPPISMHSFGTEYMDGLYRHALVLTRSVSEAEDLVQETYVRAMQAYDRLHENSNVKAWLFTILRNLWLNEIRRRRVGPEIVQIDEETGVSEQTLPGKMPDALSLLQEEEDSARVRDAIKKLSPEFQEVLVLRNFEELSYSEIANVLRCPMGTVMSRLGRAREKLRKLLT